MPRIAEFDGIRLSVYFKDHNPPHVHANYGKFDAAIAIRTGRFLDGDLPKKQLAAVRRYLREHQSQVMEHWDAAQEG